MIKENGTTKEDDSIENSAGTEVNTIENNQPISDDDNAKADGEIASKESEKTVSDCQQEAPETRETEE